MSTTTDSPSRLPAFLSGRTADGAPYDPRGSWGLYASHIGDYMRRYVLRTPWFTVRLHRILRPDDDRDMHDHPFDFVSLVLRGGYLEETPTQQVFREVGDVARRRAEDVHAIRSVAPGTLTLVFTGPYRRRWGYATPSGWVYWRDYHRAVPVGKLSGGAT